MELQTCDGNVSISARGLFINCKTKDLNNIFESLFKLIPKETKIKDIKKIMTDKISMMMK